MSITGDLTGLRHNKVARWQVFVVKSNETLRSKGIKMPAEEPMSELNDGQEKNPKKRHKKSLENQGFIIFWYSWLFEHRAKHTEDFKKLAKEIENIFQFFMENRLI